MSIEPQVFDDNADEDTDLYFEPPAIIGKTMIVRLEDGKARAILCGEIATVGNLPSCCGAPPKTIIDLNGGGWFILEHPQEQIERLLERWRIDNPNHTVISGPHFAAADPDTRA